MLIEDSDFSYYKKIGREIYSFATAGKSNAKRFRVGKETFDLLVDITEKHFDLYEAQRKFAKPPFEECYVEYDTGSPSSGTFIGILWRMNTVIALYSVAATKQEKELLSQNVKVLLSRHCAKVRPEGVSVEFMTPRTPDADETNDNLLALTRITEVLWLLMARPGVVKSERVPVQRKIVRGKPKVWRAHDVLKIDLAPKELTRIIANGSRGSGVVEHEVRGHWMHWRYVRSCEHQWQKVEVKEFAPERWECPCCGSIRVWRKDHVKGDASRGTKFHTYEVTHSGLSHDKRNRRERSDLQRRPQEGRAPADDGDVRQHDLGHGGEDRNLDPLRQPASDHPARGEVGRDD